MLAKGVTKKLPGLERLYSYEEMSMDEKISLQDARMKETESIKAFVRNLGIDLVGIADMSLLQGIPSGLPGDAQTFLQ